MEQQKKEQFEVRDMRHKEKFQVDDLYLNGYAKKVGVYGTAVYVSLCRHADKQQQCYPSLGKLAEEHNCSKKQIGRAIKELEKQNIIKKLRIGKKLNNRYLLLDKSEWTNSPITGDWQSTHLGTGSPLHSKDTHLRNTHNKEDKNLKLSFRGQPTRVYFGTYQVFSCGDWKNLDPKYIPEVKEG